MDVKTNPPLSLPLTVKGSQGLFLCLSPSPRRRPLLFSSVRLHHLAGSNPYLNSVSADLDLKSYAWSIGNSHRTCIPSLTKKSRAPSILTTGSHRFSRWQQIRYRYAVLLPVSASRLRRLLCFRNTSARYPCRNQLTLTPSHQEIP